MRFPHVAVSLRLLPLFPVLGGCTTYVPAQSAAAEHTITVGGSASLDVVPDEACVELTLVAHDAAMPAAHGALVANDAALLAELRQRPSLVVEQGAPSYAPEYDAAGHLARYSASSQVNVRTRDFAQIPDVIGRAAPRGLERVGVVYYSTQIVHKKAEVRASALEAARQKAHAMADALGVGLGDVFNVVEGDSRTSASVGTSNYLERAAVDKTSDVPAPPGSIPLAVDVTVVYRLR